MSLAVAVRPTASAELTVDELTVRFGGIVALDRASLHAAAGAITGLIGPNGAGKTTLFNCLTGIYRASSGRISFAGVEIFDKAPHDVAALGISRTFQNLALFPRLTVRENVAVGLHRTRSTGWLANALRMPSVLREERATLEAAQSVLDEIGLGAVADRPAVDLPYGTLKRIELARAVVSSPGLLLLDEPAAGLAHSEVDELMGLVGQLRDSRDLTVVLVEHHMGMVMRLCDHVTVLNFGQTIAAGPPAEISQNPAVIEAYLGSAE